MLTLILLTTAGWADTSVGVEFQSLAIPDPDFDLFQEGSGMATLGLRGEMEISPGLRGVLGLHHGVTGGLLDTWNDDEDSANGAPAFGAAFTLDSMSLGAKAQTFIGGEHLGPYAVAQLMASRGVIRLDSDTENEDTPGETRQAGFAPGGYAAVGAEIRSSTIPLALHLEMGAHGHQPMQFGDLGELNLYGFLLRAGLGARF